GRVRSPGWADPGNGTDESTRVLPDASIRTRSRGSGGAVVLLLDGDCVVGGFGIRTGFGGRLLAVCLLLGELCGRVRIGDAASAGLRQLRQPAEGDDRQCDLAAVGEPCAGPAPLREPEAVEFVPLQVRGLEGRSRDDALGADDGA